MKKLFLIFTIFMLSIASHSSGQKKKTVAVLDFRSIAAPSMYGIGVAEILRTELSTLGGYVVLERGALNKVLEEQKLQLTSLVDSKTAAEVGALVGANFVVVGSVVKFGHTFTINARLVDVKTAQVRIAQNVRGNSESELSAMVNQLALILTGKTAVTVKIPQVPPGRVTAAPPPSTPPPATKRPQEAGIPAPGSRPPRPEARRYPGMVHIPGGSFLMGSDDGPKRERPVHQVFVNGFHIDQYEVSNDSYRKFRVATGHSPPRYWTEKEYNRRDYPVVGVSWKDATAYCEWAGKRLPNEGEWEKAARGIRGLRAKHRYPWGNERPNRGGIYRANYDPGNFKEDGYAGLAPIRTFEVGAAVWPTGKVYNLVGNVREWTSSYFEPYPDSSFKSRRMGRKYRVVRGGSWKDSGSYLRVSGREGWRPRSRQPNIGFRCVRDE